MPNYCDYGMYVVGHREQIEEFIKIMQLDYNGSPDEPKHMWRIFDAVADEIVDNYLDTGLSRVNISGYCAWSVESCMNKSGYYRDHPEKSTSLIEESLNKNLFIEVESCECGIGFSEHYTFVNGCQVRNECVDYEEFNPYECDQEELDHYQRQTGKTFEKDDDTWYGILDNSIFIDRDRGILYEDLDVNDKYYIQSFANSLKIEPKSISDSSELEEDEDIDL